MAKSFLTFLKYSLFVMLALFRPIGADEGKRASQSELIRLSGHVPVKAISRALSLGNLDMNTRIPITFTLPLRNQETLKKLITRLYDPKDTLYKRHLTSEEFIEQFAPTQEDYDKVIAYAKSVGMKFVAAHPNRTLLNVSAPVEAVQSAFNLQLHEYQLPNGRVFFAPDHNPEIPSSIASIISGVIGLDSQAVWKPFHRKQETFSTAEETFLTPQVNAQSFPSGPGGGFAPQDIATAYNLLGISANGTNQNIALFQLASYQASDINEYASFFGLPTPNLTNVLVDGGSTSGMDAEVAIDIELALALAPNSNIFVYEGPNSGQGVLDTYNRIATDNIAKQVSTSWGLGEDLIGTTQIQSESSIFLQMAAQGQTIYAAAGDTGAYGDYTETGSQALIVEDPASQPYVVGVGGTHLTVDVNTGSYQDETVWNDGLAGGSGGGGVSAVWSIPSWQTNVATASSMTRRNVPDVCLNADPSTGYAIYYNGQWAKYGGTSCAAPLWAGFTACVNEQLAATQLPALGFLNPVLYGIGVSTSYGSDFHDITQGDNFYYTAQTGYDNASGWGAFNGGNLFADLTQLTPRLNPIMKHNSFFTKGKIGTYRIVISNLGNAPTSGPVTVSVTLPSGLGYSSFSGSGWQRSGLTFTQNATLAPGASYSTIVLNVNVALDCPNTVIPTTTVAGGGSVSSTVTNLTTTR